MKQKIELTSKLVLAIIGLAAVSAILVPTYAVPTIRSGDIFDGEVKTADLANNAVTSPKIKNGEVKAEDIAPGVIPSGGALPNVHIVRGDEVIAPQGGGAEVAEANCPDGEVLTGGGFLRNGGIVQDSYPVDQDTWKFQLLNDDNFDVQMFAYAICMGPSQ